jgi:DNA-binding XRE family transcriptional regulator
MGGVVVKNPNRTLKAYRITKGYTQAYMAEYLNVATPTYTVRENGDQDFTALQINAILKLFNAKYEDIFPQDHFDNNAWQDLTASQINLILKKCNCKYEDLFLPQ